MPEYRCWSDEQEESDAIKIEAYSAAHAAEEWAERSDNYGDYTIVSGSPARVIVSDGQTRTTFDVSGESQAVYYAQEAPK